MGKYTFPEKPQHNFTKKELAQRQEILNKKIEHIKIVDFDKEKMNEKIRNKMMEKRGMKNIKVRFFN